MPLQFSQLIGLPERSEQDVKVFDLFGLRLRDAVRSLDGGIEPTTGFRIIAKRQVCLVAKRHEVRGDELPNS